MKKFTQNDKIEPFVRLFEIATNLKKREPRKKLSVHQWKLSRNWRFPSV